jgi:hypothetical protein
MSRTSLPADHPTNTTPTTAGSQSIFSYGAGAIADSSRPSTASAARSETYGGYGGVSQGQVASNIGFGVESRRQSTESTSQTPAKAFGVHSMLNPPTDVETQAASFSQPVARSELDPSQMYLPPPAGSPQGRKRSALRSPGRENDTTGTARAGRRLLTPKSPGTRAASLGARRNPAFHSTMQPLLPQSTAAQQAYPAEPVPYQKPNIPPLPPLAIATTRPLGNMGQYDSSQPRSALSAESPVHAIQSLVTPTSERPLSNTLSYPKFETQSPGARYGAPQPALARQNEALRPSPALGANAYGSEAMGHGPHEGYQQGGASYQMTLDTDQGPMNIPVELDLQQASKVADEKRKRNAGASARFRARRKEKEKEASQTISGLQQELRDLIEERDHYLTERNYFRDLAARQGAHILQRPPSPQHRRRLSGAAMSPNAGTHDNTVLSDDSYRERADSDPSAQRRRTGDYQPSFTDRQTHSPPPSAFRASFPSQPPITLPPPPPTSSQDVYGTPRVLPAASLPQGVTRSHSYDPFRRDLFDRSWAPGHGQS